MKLLVDGRALAANPGRLASALAGLAARGHDVAWYGGHAPAIEGVRAIGRSSALHAEHPDLVASAGRPGSAARVLWWSRARGLLLESSAASLSGWSTWDRIAWGTSRRWALLDPSQADHARAGARPDVLPHVALWPERADGAEAVQPAAMHPDTAFLEVAAERLLAECRGPRAWPAVFLDRDGTLILERGYLSDPDGVELLPGVAAALRQMHAAGVALVVISNQAGIGRGRFPEEKAWATMARLRRLLRAEGVELDAIRFCPHAPDAGCACRKPGTALLEEAAQTLHLSLVGSVMAGDRWLDAAAGRAAGAAGILLRTGYGREEEARVAAGEVAAPDVVLEDLPALAQWVTARLESL